MTEKQEKDRRINKLFGVWLPIDVHGWFVNYLKVKSICFSTGERFRQWFCAVQNRIRQRTATCEQLTLEKVIVKDLER